MNFVKQTAQRTRAGVKRRTSGLPETEDYDFIFSKSIKKM